MSTPERPHDEPAPPPWAAGTETREHELNPTLTDAQLDLLRRAGTEQTFPDGHWLWKVGDRDTPLYGVLEGAIDVLRRDIYGEDVVLTYGPRQFSGETHTMSGRGALLAGRARGNLRAIVVPQPKLHEVLAVNAGLGELVMQAFILRRMRMIAQRIGPVTLIGSRYAAETLRVRDFLTRNGIPHEYVDLEEADDVEDLLAKFDLKCDETPIVMCNGVVLRNPTLEAVAECLRISPVMTAERLYDVAIIGAGPAGLAAAVYAASEGLSVMVIEQLAPGGQAGTSSRIENYPGFPTGISGQALAGRVWLQGQKFGAQYAIPREVQGLSPGATELRVALAGGEVVRARTAVIASGVIYRQPDIPGLDRFTGVHVHYAASYLESLLCRDQEVAVLGGGNSAGQAAVYLAGYARHVYILVRGEGLAESMSRYLIRRIEKTPNITLLPHTELSGIEGGESLAGVRWRNSLTGEETEHPVRHIFVFIGAVPCTDYLDPSIARDAHGYIKTGTALSEAERARYKAAGGRPPQFLETSWPRVFAIGDVRAGSLKRVASAVGDGAAVVSLLHDALQS